MAIMPASGRPSGHSGSADAQPRGRIAANRSTKSQLYPMRGISWWLRRAWCASRCVGVKRGTPLLQLRVVKERGESQPWWDGS